MFNATFNNIAVISWWSVLLVEETGVPEENHGLLYKIQNYFNGNSTYNIVCMYMIDVIQVHVYIQRYYTIMRMKLHMIIRYPVMFYKEKFEDTNMTKCVSRIRKSKDR